jgi:hypothetical protein
LSAAIPLLELLLLSLSLMCAWAEKVLGERGL